MVQSILVIFGGIPTAKGIAPSITFLVIYLALLAELIWRVMNKVSRTWILFRVVVFSLARMVAFTTRLIIAVQIKDDDRNNSISLIVAEVSLIISGFMVILEACSLVFYT
jgi:hypothetical protein